MPADTAYAELAPPAATRPPPDGDARSDVVVVGGGLTGLSAALHLARMGRSVRVIEAGAIASGASGRSGGQLLPDYGGGVYRIAALLGEAAARRAWDLSVEAVDLVADLAREIPCDLAWGHMQVAIKPRHLGLLEAYLRECQAFGYSSLRLLDAAQTRARIASPRYIGGLLDERGGHLDPLALTRGLAAAAERAGAVIHEHTRFLDHKEDADGIEVATGSGARLSTRHLVLSGNAWIGSTVTELAGYAMPIRTFVIATEKLGEDRARALLPHNDAAYDLNNIMDYFRLTSDRRLLFGGQASYRAADPPDLKGWMGRRLRRVFPQLTDVPIAHGWGGTVAITRNRLPHLGRLGGRIVFSHGFSGHGIALGVMSGKLMAEAIAGASPGFDLLAAIPHRRFPGGTRMRVPALVLGGLSMRLKDLL